MGIVNFAADVFAAPGLDTKLPDRKREKGFRARDIAKKFIRLQWDGTEEGLEKDSPQVMAVLRHLFWLQTSGKSAAELAYLGLLTEQEALILDWANEIDLDKFTEGDGQNKKMPADAVLKIQNISHDINEVQHPYAGRTVSEAQDFLSRAEKSLYREQRGDRSWASRMFLPRDRRLKNSLNAFIIRNAIIAGILVCLTTAAVATNGFGLVPQLPSLLNLNTPTGFWLTYSILGLASTIVMVKALQSGYVSGLTFGLEHYGQAIINSNQKLAERFRVTLGPNRAVLVENRGASRDGENKRGAIVGTVTEQGEWTPNVLTWDDTLGDPETRQTRIFNTGINSDDHDLKDVISEDGFFYNVGASIKFRYTDLAKFASEASAMLNMKTMVLADIRAYLNDREYLHAIKCGPDLNKTLLPRLNKQLEIDYGLTIQRIDLTDFNLAKDLKEGQEKSSYDRFMELVGKIQTAQFDLLASVSQAKAVVIQKQGATLGQLNVALTAMGLRPLDLDTIDEISRKALGTDGQGETLSSNKVVKVIAEKSGQPLLAKDIENIKSALTLAAGISRAKILADGKNVYVTPESTPVVPPAISAETAGSKLEK